MLLVGAGQDSLLHFFFSVSTTKRNIRTIKRCCSVDVPPILPSRFLFPKYSTEDLLAHPLVFVFAFSFPLSDLSCFLCIPFSLMSPLYCTEIFLLPNLIVAHE